MTTETQPGTSKTKDLVNKDGNITQLVEWATQDANSVDDLIELFGDQGVSYTSGEELTGDYKVVTGDEKQLWMKQVQGKRLFVVKWKFHTPEGGNEFVTAHIVIDGMGKFIVNDSAKSGMYGQLSMITMSRLDSGQSGGKEMTGVLVERGFKANKPFFYNEKTGKAWKPGDDEKDKKPARQTWRLEF